MILSRIKRLFLGQPLSRQSLHQEKLPPWRALSTLSADALSSVAYASQEILLVLSSVAVGGIAVFNYSIPISFAIGALLLILTLSYRQTIDAYPNGGGAYLVAKDNLGDRAGLIAAAALLVDYLLTVAVSISAGVENLISAFPTLLPHQPTIGLAMILVLALMNLRGMRDSSMIFAFPTYFFILSILALLVTGAFRLSSGSLPSAPPGFTSPLPEVGIILLVRAFAAGCVALTGVEAISDGVPSFREPAQANAKKTLTIMALLLGTLFIGVTYLANTLGLVPHEQSHETLLSMIGRTVYGEGLSYYSVQLAIALVLFLAANTAYADFPRVAYFLSRDRYLPRQFTNLGDRLVFSNGIIWLSLGSAVLILVFKGKTHQLLPLYAMGVFLSFTLSQAGMVLFHRNKRTSTWKGRALVSGLGAITTFIVLVDICIAKFSSGAWMLFIMVPSLVWLFLKINRHYKDIAKQLTLPTPSAALAIQPIKHTVIIPVSGLHQGVITALQYAVSISNDVRACYVEIDPDQTTGFLEQWNQYASRVPLVVLKSPYRSVIDPIFKYLDDVELANRGDLITVVIPEFVTEKWWHQLLHNQTAFFIRAALLFKRRRVVTSVRHHLTGTQH